MNPSVAANAANAAVQGMATVIEFLQQTNDPNLAAAQSAFNTFAPVNTAVQTAYQNSGGPSQQGMGN